MEAEKKKIAEYVIQEYEEIREYMGDLELDLLSKVKVDTVSDRFNMVFLATLFSGWAMKEERAYSIWQNVTEILQESELELLYYLDGIEKLQVSNFAKEYGVPPKIASNIWETSNNLKKYDGDINGLIQEDNWARTIEKIRSNCKGIHQKAFWVARVMRQKNAWSVPGQYCCVSDSHNKSFLKKTGFIKSDADLYYNSRIIWNYFNKPFDNHYYDLPVFRFARRHKCTKCSAKICNLERLSSCRDL